MEGFPKLEKHNKKSNNNDSELDESEESEDTSEEEEEETGDEDFDEDDLSDLSDIDDPALVATYKALMSEKVNKNLGEEEQKTIDINFTDDQMERFEAYRRMTVNKPGVKKICNGIVGHTIPQIIAVVMAGVSKLFLGEIISKAFEIQERNSKGRLLMDIETKKKQREIISSLQRERKLK